MHEVSLVAALIATCEEQAAGRPVDTVRVRHASSITDDSLQQAFRLLAEDSGLAGATLETEPFDVPLRCPCGFDGILGHDDLVGGSMAVCPSCGDITTMSRTSELELLEVRTSA